MWFQQLASLLILILIIWGVYKFTGINKYVKFEDDVESEEEQSALELSIVELENKKKMLIDLEQSITVKKQLTDINKQLALLTKKLNK